MPLAQLVKEVSEKHRVRDKQGEEILPRLPPAYSFLIFMGTRYCVGPIIIVFLLLKLLQIHSKVYSQTKSSNSVGKWGLPSPFSSLPLGPRVEGIIWVLEIVQPSMAQASNLSVGLDHVEVHMVARILALCLPELTR